jgi:hypothetical protein
MAASDRKGVRFMGTLQISLLLSELRSGAIPNDGICNLINQYPTIDKARALIEPMDLPMVQRLLASTSFVVRRLGYSLLRKLSNEVPVRQFVENQWWRDDVTFDERIALQFLLLSYRDLDTKFHESLFSFTIQFWEQWLSDAVKWANGKDSVIRYCHDRLASAELPNSKRWVYLCCAAASNDFDAAIKLITSYSEDADPFLRHVVQVVLRRLEISR